MANRPPRSGPRLVVGFCAIVISIGSQIRPAPALDVEARPGSERIVSQRPVGHKHTANANPPVSSEGLTESKPAHTLARKPEVAGSAKGPYYVDFRARTAASYGHAFVWFGKTSERKVDVAGLHPAGDVLPYVLGHLMWVPSETGASYGDLDAQYLTANYRVYLNEPDTKRVFAYIKKLQATSPLWNAQTSNCTAFIGSIATFMGLKTPFHLKVPEDYVNSLKEMNGGRRLVQLTSEQQLSAGQ